MNRVGRTTNWRQIKGKAQAKWPLLSEEDLDRIAGRREELIGKLQEKYGKNRIELEREVDRWYRTV